MRSNAPTRRTFMSALATVVVAGGLLIAAPSAYAAESAVAHSVAAPTSSAPTALRALKAGSLSIVGSAATGQKLTAKSGTWTANTARKYQWFVAGKAVVGATASTYKVRPTDVDRVITVKVTGTKTGYVTKTVTSAATKKVMGKVYATCAAMNKDYPNGVRKFSTKGDKKSGVLKPFKGVPFASDTLYAKQSIARDGDRDGIMCER